MHQKMYLDRYRVIRQLGEGGMGRVFLARQVDLNREVVVKVMHEHVASDPRFQQCFLQEMQVMAQFQHPYAVALYDAKLDSQDGPCIIMEYVKGKTLDVVLRDNKRFTPQRASRLLGQLCEVLHDAHNKGIVHRDLKPSNLMILDADTQYEKLKVMDFGLAKFTAGPTLKSASENNEYMLGTPAYVSPEQARGEETDHRTDIYSMGVIVYEMLTGRIPFDGLSTMDTLLAHAIEQPPPMASEEYFIPPSIERVVMKCLAKRPEERYNTAREFYSRYMEALTAGDDIYQSHAPMAAPQAQPSQRNSGVMRTQDAVPPPLPDILDPATLAYQMQAWMPHTVASFKLTGFIQDVRGELVESLPGKIRVLLGAKGTPYAPPSSGWFSWTSPKPDTEMELQLFESNDPKHKNYVWITVVLRFIGKKLTAEWRERGEQIFRDLRGYLIGATAEHQ